MSTNINITVGDNALLDSAKANQVANRQTQLEREASQRLAAEATDARTKAQAAAGKDANGNSLYGVPITKPDIDRRPAATNNQVNTSMLLVPNPLAEGEDTLRVISRSTQTQLYFDPGYYANPAYNRAGFLSGEGPNGADAAGYVAATLGPTYNAGGYMLNIGRTGDPNIYDYGGNEFLYSTQVQLDGFAAYTPNPRVPEKFKISKLSYWTVESWIRAGFNVGQSNTQVSSIISGPGFDFGFSIGNQVNGPGNPYGNGPYSISALGVYGVNYANPPSVGEPVFGIGSPFYSSHTSWRVWIGDSKWVSRGDPNQIVPSVVVPTINYGSWHHFAAVYSSGEYSFYFDGRFLFTIALPLLAETSGEFYTAPLFYLIPWSELPIRIGAQVGSGANTEIDGGPAAFHGLRFTPRVLYSSNFTPPPTITTLA